MDSILNSISVYGPLALVFLSVGWWIGRHFEGRRADARDKMLELERSRLEARSAVLEQELSEQKLIEQENRQSLQRIAQLETLLEAEKRRVEDALHTIEETRLQLMEHFSSISAQALQKNNQAFLELASNRFKDLQEGASKDLEGRKSAIKDLLAPFQKDIEKFNDSLRELERSRTHAYASLTEQVKQLSVTQTKLEVETSQLVQSLRRPTVRGRWGEVQLRRVVELSGMTEHCDFSEQVVAGPEGKHRPDMLVRLPGDKVVVVDAKVSLQGYLEAVESSEESEKKAGLKRHAQQVKNHITGLASKAYWEQFDTTPEFVVLFLPGECFFSAALESDPTLIEFGMENHVVVATPTTLIALLRAVAFGWDQQAMTQNARELQSAGKELYERLVVFADHFREMRRSLDRSVLSYNKAVGSLESRVFVSARKLCELGALSSREIPTAKPLDLHARVTNLPELSDDVNTEDDPQTQKKEASL